MKRSTCKHDEARRQGEGVLNPKVFHSKFTSWHALAQSTHITDEALGSAPKDSVSSAETASKVRPSGHADLASNSNMIPVWKKQFSVLAKTPFLCFKFKGRKCHRVIRKYNSTLNVCFPAPDSVSGVQLVSTENEIEVVMGKGAW